MNKKYFCSFFLMIFFCSFSIKSDGQKLVISGNELLPDDSFSIQVTNLNPGQPFILRASMLDSSGRSWHSFAGFYANEKGFADLAKLAPANGTYSGVNSMGLIQSMNLAGPDYNKQRYLYKFKDPTPIRFNLELDGKLVDSFIVSRTFIKTDIRVMDLRKDGLIGTLFYSTMNKSANPIIVLGGSEGGLSGEDVAAALANRGFAALTLAYFNLENLPAAIDGIPVEYFKKAIDWIRNLDFVNRKGVAIVGTSKGSEAALLTATLYKEIIGVVAYVPSHVIWSCICNNSTNSSWSYSGKSIPFVGQVTDPTYRPQAGFPFRPAVNYLYRLKNNNNFKEVVIPVEKINGPVLLISGKDDQLWPSYFMANSIMDRLKRYHHPFNDQHLSYEKAGHLIGKLYFPSGSTLIAGGRIETGGTSEGNAFAQQNSWPKVLKFLKDIFDK